MNENVSNSIVAQKKANRFEKKFSINYAFYIFFDLKTLIIQQISKHFSIKYANNFIGFLMVHRVAVKSNQIYHRRYISPNTTDD